MRDATDDFTQIEEIFRQQLIEWSREQKERREAQRRFSAVTELRGIFLMEFRARQNERVVNPSPSTTPPQSQR